MSPRRIFLPIVACTLLFLTSCAGTPVRNLASDAALIKAGETSRRELLNLLGEPDERQIGRDKQETWIYHEKETSWLKSTPVVGRLFSPRKEESLVVSIRDNVVFSARYNSFAYDQQRWNKDFDWQQGDKK